MKKNRIWRRRTPIVLIITTLLTMAALLVIIGGRVFAVAILLLQQQQAGATITIDTTPVAKHNKCSGDLITCTSDKTYHSTKDDSTPFNLPLPFP